MADYVWTIGTGDQMMIRDTGTLVEFWFHSDTSTFNHEQPFAFTINGHTVSSTFDLPADGAWHRLGYENVTTDQTVSFTIYDAGLGWPTSTHTAVIDRASAPAKPNPPILTVRGSTVIELDLGADGSNNGAAIDSRQYAGNSGNAVPASNYKAAVNNYQWTGLNPGTKYYFWERTHNAKGYSPWSNVATATTWNVPAAPAAPTISNVADTTLDVSYAAPANNGQTIDQYEVGYGLDPNGADRVSVASDRADTLTGLTPGATYYIWARAHNSIGWSAWSAKSTVTMKRPPDAPTTPVVSEVKMTSMRVIFGENGDGGSPITGYEIGYGWQEGELFTLPSDKDDILTDLIPGTYYWVWGRAQNAYGWGPWSATAAVVRTVAGARVLVGTTWYEAVAYVKVAGVWKPAKPWARIAGVWKETT